MPVNVHTGNVLFMIKKMSQIIEKGNVNYENQA